MTQVDCFRDLGSELSYDYVEWELWLYKIDMRETFRCFLSS